MNFNLSFIPHFIESNYYEDESIFIDNYFLIDHLRRSLHSNDSNYISENIENICEFKYNDKNNNEKIINIENISIKGNFTDLNNSNNSTISLKDISSNKNENIQSYKEDKDNNLNFQKDSENNKSCCKKTKRGRKKLKILDNNRIHSKYSKDNIKRKIQVHYLKFLRNVLNQIINQLLEKNRNIEFYPLNYNFTKNIDKNSFELIKQESIGNIFKNHVSRKYKDYDSLNIRVYDKVINENAKLKNILDKTYLEFNHVYYFNKINLNLSIYGLNKIINLSKDSGFFKDLLKESEDDIIYSNKIKKVINHDFFGAPIFICK